MEFIEVEIPNYLKADLKGSTETDIVEMDIMAINNDGTEILGKMRFTIPAGDEETLVSFEMTSNVFDQTDLTPDFWVNLENDNSLKSTMGIGTCLKACRSFDKGDGRGWCKAGCWGELFLKAAAVVVAIVAL